MNNSSFDQTVWAVSYTMRNVFEKDLSGIGNNPYTRERDNPSCIIKDTKLV